MGTCTGCGGSPLEMYSIDGLAGAWAMGGVLAVDGFAGICEPATVLAAALAAAVGGAETCTGLGESAGGAVVCGWSGAGPDAGWSG